MNGSTLGQPPTTLCFQIPLEVISEANRRDHWRVKAARAKRQRSVIALHCRSLTGKPKPAEVMLTRLAPRKLDDDNLSSAFKAVRDEVAKLMGFDDRNEMVTWRYGQRKPDCFEGIEIIVTWSRL